MLLMRILVSCQLRITRLASSHRSPRVTRQRDLTTLIIHLRGQRSRDPLIVQIPNESRAFEQRINTASTCLPAYFVSLVNRFVVVPILAPVCVDHWPGPAVLIICSP